MDRLSLVTAQQSSLPILIMDKEGSIGTALYARLREYVQVVLVSGAEPEESQNLLYLSFTKSIPHIPDEQYSHIFLVPETESEIEDVFETLVEKAKQSKGKLILLLSKAKITEKTKTLVQRGHSNVYVLILGDLFGGVIVKKLKSPVEKLFVTAKHKKGVNLANMGLTPHFPIEFADAITEIIRVSFGRPAGRLFFLYPQQGVTELSMAHSLQKIDPLLKIDFKKEERETQEKQIFEEGEYLLAEEYPLEEKMQRCYETFIAPEELPIEEDFWGEDNSKNYLQSKGSIPVKKFFWEVVIFLIFVAILPFLTLVSAVGIGFAGLYATKSALSSGNLTAAKNASLLAGNAFAISKVAGIVANEEIGTMFPDILDSPLAIVTAGDKLSQSVQTVLFISTRTADALKNKTFSTDTLQESIDEVKSAALSIQEQMENSFIPQDIKQTVADKLTQVSPVLNVLDALPDVAGVDGKKTYLVLFQNNMELRPGGGFIGSYGLLAVDKGSVVDFSIHDVYDADGLLKGHIEPPFPIRRYIPKVHLYLRDSNYSIDFAKNASIAALLFQQETGQHVDGVFAVDLSFVKSILGIIGNVYVPGYNETVTSNNFFLLTEKHAEKDTFAGSSQKQDFLRGLFAGVQAKFADIKQLPYSKMLTTILQAVLEKHVQVAFNNSGVEDVVVANSFASSLWDSRSSGQNIINDVLSVNEANIGVNKVNYFIARTIAENTNIQDDGTVTESTTINYTNTDTTNAWPGGTYTNYLRFFLPKGTTLTKILIDGVEQTTVPAVTDPANYEAKNFKAPTGLEVEQTEEGNTVYYGLLVSVAPGKTKQITIFYTLSQKVDVSQPVFTYSQWVIKQPGTDVYPFSINITYPKGYSVLDTTKLQQEDTMLRFSGNQATDLLLSVRFGKK